MDPADPELEPLRTTNAEILPAEPIVASTRSFWPTVCKVALCGSFVLILPGLKSGWSPLHWRSLQQNLRAFTSDGVTVCDPLADIPSSGKRKFNLTGVWKEKCASLPHPSTTSDTDPAENWCWEYMKHNGCYATHGYSSWFEDQLKLSQLGQAPPPFDRALRLEGLEEASLCEVPEFGRDWQVVGEIAVSKLKSMISVYVLSLSEERWHLISRRLEQLRFEAVQRIPGVDLSLPGAFQAAVEEGLLPKVPSKVLKHQEGTFGCAAGHLRVLKTAERVTHSPLALVLEDDVHLHEDFFGNLASILSEVPCDWEVISLKSRCPYGRCVSKHLSKVMVDGNGGSGGNGGNRAPCSGLNFGFFAMLYKVDALPKLQGLLSKALEKCHDVDVALASTADRVAYYAVPAIQQPGLLHELHLPSIREAKNAGTTKSA